MTQIIPLHNESQLSPDMQLMLHEIREVRGMLEKVLELERPLTAKKAAEHLGLSTRVFSKMLNEGTFPAKYIHKAGKRRRFFASQLNQYAKSK